MAMERRIVECVPNFSEGRNMDAIRQISQEIEQTKGVRLLNIDPGEATNRTVITFVGDPDAVVEAAFRAVRKAAQVIDMRQHHGAHPRIGATDVLPLIPVSGITLEECAELARQLAKRIADELRIPCYCYEAAAYSEERRNLAVCRAGEYEGIAKKLSTPGKEPDFGSRPYDDDIARTGCTVVGARDFLIAVNFNLNTTSTRRANAIAFDVREKGRPRREGNPIVGKPMKDAEGNTIMIPGTLKKTKAIGWFIDEYGIAQVSMNITDINVTPLHKAFDEVCRCAQARGIRVTGTEIVGLVPKRTLIEAGKYFLEKQHRSTGIPEDDIVKIAIHSMGLDDLRPFNPREKVIEYLLEDANQKSRLTDLTVKGFAEETSRESPAPGGGTISAYMGALGAALGAMVANLSAPPHRRGHRGLQPHHGSLRHAQDHRPREGGAHRGHTDDHALCLRGAPAHDEGSHQGDAPLPADGHRRQSQQCVGRRRGSPGSKSRRAGCRTQREDQRRLAARPRESRGTHP